jgi:hypothetical protein
MELTELKNIWNKSDKKISNNTDLNKEILKKLILSKSEKKINWSKIKIGFNLIAPLAIIIFVLIPNIDYRVEIGFYIGVLLFGLFYGLFYYWEIKYYILLKNIDFQKPITTIKNDLKRIEKFKVKLTKFSFILSPIALIGIFLLGNISILSSDSIIPISLIIIVMMISIYFTFRFSIFGYFKKLNAEINEIEQLEY